MLDFLVAADPAPALADLAYTLQVGREAMPSRLAMVVRERGELLRGLTAFLEAPGSPEAASIPMFMGDMEEDQGIGDLLASEAVRQVLLKERNLEQLALYWTRGGDIPWEVLHEGESPRLIRPAHLSLCPGTVLACREPGGAILRTRGRARRGASNAVRHRSRDSVRAFLLHFLSRELRLTPDQVRPHRDLRDYGADSITAMRLIRAVEQEFQVNIPGATCWSTARCMPCRHTSPPGSTHLRLLRPRAFLPNRAQPPG